MCSSGLRDPEPGYIIRPWEMLRRKIKSPKFMGKERAIGLIAHTNNTHTHTTVPIATTILQLK